MLRRLPPHSAWPTAAAPMENPYCSCKPLNRLPRLPTMLVAQLVGREW